MTVAEYCVGIDYGAKRIGVAIAHTVAKLPHPLRTLENNPEVIAELRTLIEHEKAGRVIVGLPHSLDGSESQQTRDVLAFVGQLRKQLEVPIYLVEEALSSVEAENVLKAKSNKPYSKADIDAMAAALILERYFEDETSAELAV